MILSVTCDCFTASECSMGRALYHVKKNGKKLLS